MDTTAKYETWQIVWRDRHGQVQTLEFELGRGLRYRVVIHDEHDKQRFLQMFLRPPQTALLVEDGGLLGNITVDENVLLPLSYRGVDTGQLEAHVLELFGMCGMDEKQTRLLLSRLPHQLSPYQKRAVGFVRSLLVQPGVMVYASIWHGVSQAESRQIIGFDAICRRFVPACTGVFVDYDTDMDSVSPEHRTYYL